MTGVSQKEHNAMTTEVRHALSELRKGDVSWDVSMGEYCTLRAGGKAEALVVVSSLQELRQLICWLRERNIRWQVIGRGSNILVTGKGFKGVLILLGDALNGVDFAPYNEDKHPGIVVGAGCSVARLVAWCTKKSLSGLEFMAGIPGSVGGAVYMNAGAWGSEISDVLTRVSIVDSMGFLHNIASDEISFSYRSMKPKALELNGGVIVQAEFLLKPGIEQEIQEKCREYQRLRRQKQPLGMPSAGSFFKNPEGDSAGRLIEAAGLKGLRKGDAMVSPVHANFIVNTGQASADDIVELMHEVKEKVYKAFGVLLEPEVQLL